MKGTTDPNQYYDGIRARTLPLIINFQSSIIQQSPVKGTPGRKPLPKNQNVATPSNQNVSAADSSVELVPASPASPILKAQLSAPPKPKESPTKPDVKSQV